MKLTTTAADAIQYPLFDLKKIVCANGGYSIDTTTIPTGLDYIKRGTLIQIASATRLAKVFKTVAVITGGSTSAPRVTKNNLFKVSDSVVAEGHAEARTISAIDTTTSTLYDVLTLSGAITGLAAADVLQLAVGAGMTGYGGSVSDKAAEEMVIKVYDPAFLGKGIVLKANGSDALAVAYAANVLTISLAATTDASNTIGAIQAAIRALGTTGGVAFGDMVVLGTQSGHGAVLANPATDATAFDVDIAYTIVPNAMVLDTVKNEGTPTVTAVIAAMDMEEVNLPYPISAAVKAALGVKFHFKA